ncbi:iron-containing alcohol dehydrogenase [Thermosyntropha sp.]|uniref:iron-containing alcohol dehydrogenase n=1 Tax=Thermosyntropha sp. TaxID=2740820 RepID=UPI0025CC2D2F|nr:iron-containing alcohol dehydrogenase [Thermosyntropha sp.]MBO8159617.1 iron-containing alcohol dehydrogenase [Thermosyntropha sp.]
MGTPKYFVWDFRTIVEVGSGCRTFAPQRFMEMGAKRVALVTDKGLVKAGIADQIKEMFEVQGEPKLVGIYDDIEQDAVMRVINDCASWCRVNAVDGLLGVGGGSVLDSVKGVKLMLGMGATDIKELMPGNVGPYIRPLGKPLNIPNVSIPTTAGTGSEVSPIAVIYNEEQKVKGDLLHPYIAADYALLDPDLTVGLPPHMTACTGFDALGHAVEGLTSPGSNPMIDSLSIQAIRLILKYLPVAVNEGANLEARTCMLIASNIAIMGFAMSGMFYPVHNVAHALGGQLRIPHGQAVGVALPSVMQHYPAHFARKAKDLAFAFGIYDDKDDLSLVAMVREKVLKLMEECHFKPYFDIIDIKFDDNLLESLFWAVKLDPSGIAYPLPEESVRPILRECFSCK